METLIPEKGAVEAPQLREASKLRAVPGDTDSRLGANPELRDDTARTAGTVALAGDGTQSFASDLVEQRRYGYRYDSPPEIVALLGRAQVGDTEAFGNLYRLHVERVSRYVAARMKDEDRQAIPDVVQDTFCEAFADLRNAHNDVTGWLLVHAAKAYIRYVRSARHQERAVKATKEVVRREYAHGYARQHPGDITAIGHAMLVHALARLTPGQREVVQHRYLDGQSQAATAVLVGKQLKATKSAEYRAIVALRAGFSDAAKQKLAPTT
jgi:DNA-directed RNA polymerase specialized sigma24 family protein